MTPMAAEGRVAVPSRQDFRHVEWLRVRWAEVDLQSIVFNGHYLMYFDTAVAGYWRALALPYHDTMASWQGDLYVRKATLEYLASARYDESLAVGVRLLRLGTSSMVLQCAVFRRDALLVHGDLVYVFADPLTQTSRPLPDALRKVLQCFEAGASMVHGLTDPAQALAMRSRLLERLTPDEAVALAQSLQGHPSDDDVQHVVLCNRLDQPVASCRWWLPSKTLVEGQLAVVDGLAVVPALRQSGLLQGLIDAVTLQSQRNGAGGMTMRVPLGLVPSLKRLGWHHAMGATDGLGQAAWVSMQTLPPTVAKPSGAADSV